MQIYRSVLIYQPNPPLKFGFESEIRAKKKFDTGTKPEKSGPKNWMNPESAHYMIQLYTVTEMLPLIIISLLKKWGIF